MITAILKFPVVHKTGAGHRIKHDAYKINIVPADATQYRSMREVYGMDPAKSE